EKPLGEREIPFERFAERLEPMQVARAFGPECFGVRIGALTQRLVLVETFNPRLAAELGGRWELARLGQRRIDMRRFGRSHRPAPVLKTFIRDRELRAFSGSGTESRRRHFRADSN